LLIKEAITYFYESIMRVKLLIFFSVFCLGFSSLATHNRAGEITYKKVNDDPADFQYEITIVTCTYTESPADRPWLQLRFGDEPLEAELDSSMYKCNLGA